MLMLKVELFLLGLTPQAPSAWCSAAGPASCGWWVAGGRLVCCLALRVGVRLRLCLLSESGRGVVAAAALWPLPIVAHLLFPARAQAFC
jgi:hypothetical protein